MHDPAIARAAIEELRKDLRARTGGKVAGPPPAAEGAPPMPEGGEPASTGGPPPQLEGGAGAEGAMMCPNCGHKMVPDEGGGEDATPAPAQLGGGKAPKEALLLIPEKKGGKGE
jgi:hypothetical protein